MELYGQKKAKKKLYRCFRFRQENLRRKFSKQMAANDVLIRSIRSENKYNRYRWRHSLFLVLSKMTCFLYFGASLAMQTVFLLHFGWIVSLFGFEFIQFQVTIFFYSPASILLVFAVTNTLGSPKTMYFSVSYGYERHWKAENRKLVVTRLATTLRCCED